LTGRTLRQAVGDIRDMKPMLEDMARSLVESGDYRVTSRLAPQAEYHSPDNSPKLVAAVVDVETTGTNPESDKIIELGIALFEYGRHDGRIYKVLSPWQWFEDPGFSIPPEISNITALPMIWSRVSALTIAPSTICWGGSSLSSLITPHSIVASWKNGFSSSPKNIGSVAVRT
jgi:hypothetical protein